MLALALTLVLAPDPGGDGAASPLLRVIQSGQTKVCQLYLAPDKEGKKAKEREERVCKQLQV